MPRNSMMTVYLLDTIQHELLVLSLPPLSNISQPSCPANSACLSRVILQEPLSRWLSGSWPCDQLRARAAGYSGLVWRVLTSQQLGLDLSQLPDERQHKRRLQFHLRCHLQRNVAQSPQSPLDEQQAISVLQSFVANHSPTLPMPLPCQVIVQHPRLSLNHKQHDK